MRLRLPGCDKRECSNQKTEADQSGHGNPPGLLSDETAQVSADDRAKTLRNHICKQVIGRAKESRKQLFRNDNQNRVRGIASDNSEKDASDVYARHNLPRGDVGQDRPSAYGIPAARRRFPVIR
jgi:hypothetical protein